MHYKDFYMRRVYCYLTL